MVRKEKIVFLAFLLPSAGTRWYRDYRFRLRAFSSLAREFSIVLRIIAGVNGARNNGIESVLMHPICFLGEGTEAHISIPPTLHNFASIDFQWNVTFKRFMRRSFFLCNSFSSTLIAAQGNSK